MSQALQRELMRQNMLKEIPAIEQVVDAQFGGDPKLKNVLKHTFAHEAQSGTLSSKNPYQFTYIGPENYLEDVLRKRAKFFKPERVIPKEYLQAKRPDQIPLKYHPFLAALRFQGETLTGDPFHDWESFYNRYGAENFDKNEYFEKHKKPMPEQDIANALQRRMKVFFENKKYADLK